MIACSHPTVLFWSVDGCYVTFSRLSHVIADKGICFGPGCFHLGCPFIPKKVFKGLQENLPDHWVVFRLHAIHSMAPAKLLNGRGQLELMEDWLFNDDGKFVLRELASPQALTFD